MMKLFKNEKGLQELRETLEEEMKFKLKALKIEKDSKIKELELKNNELHIKLNKQIKISDDLQKYNENVFEEILKDMEDMSMSLSSNASMSEEYTATVEELSASLSNISERVNRASENASISRIGMKQFSEDILQIYENTSDLFEEMKNISKVTEAINSIATQTNLLSLNASIESARAGEAGRGFSVVATEIRKLAEQAKESSGEIQNIIKNLLVKAEDTKIKALHGKEEADKIYKENEARGENIEIINEGLKDVKLGVEQVADTAQQQATNNVESSEKMESIISLINDRQK